MAKRKREAHEVKRDRLMVERLMHEGKSIPEMFAAVNDQYKPVYDEATGALVRAGRQMTRQAFQKDLEAVQGQMIQQADSDKAAERGRELRRLFLLENEAWDAWKRSQKDEVITTTEMTASIAELKLAQAQKRDPILDSQKTVVKRKGQVGDPRWIAEMRKLSRERRDLLGLDLTKPTNRPKDEDQPDMEPAEAGAILMGLMGKALRRMDEALAQGQLPAGTVIPRALLPEGVQLPEGVTVSEGAPIDVEFTTSDAAPEQDEDEILAALEADANARGGPADDR